MICVRTLKGPAVNSSATVEKKGIRNWLISLAINIALIAAVFAVSELTYETNDDIAISAEIAAGYPYVGFVSVYLCRALIAIQNIFPGANIFVYAQLIMSFIAFTVIIRIILERQESVLVTVLAILVTAYFSLDHYGCLQFTKTSALLMTAGLLWVTDAYLYERKVFYFICAFALYFTGVAFRQKGMFPAIAYSAVFMAIWWLTNRKEFFKDRKLLPEAGLVLLIIVMMIVPYGIDKASDAANASTPELRAGRLYQQERTQLTDYPFLKYTDQNMHEYEAAGFDENDLSLIDRWFFDYDGVASYENLKTINKINAPYVKADKSVFKAFKRAVKYSLESVVARDMNGWHIIFVLLIAVYLLAERRPGAWLYVLGAGALTIALYTVVYYMSRVQYRAIYVSDVNAVFWLLYCAAIGRRAERKTAGNIVLAVTIAAVLISFPASLRTINGMYDYNSTLIESPEVTAYLEENPDNFYIIPTVIAGQPQSYLTPLKTPVFPDNAADTGGWDTMTPYRLKHLRAHGIENPVKDLINNPGVYFLGDFKVKGLTQYFNKWYCRNGEKAEFIRVDEAGDLGVYQVVIR